MSKTKTNLILRDCLLKYYRYFVKTSDVTKNGYLYIKIAEQITQFMCYVIIITPLKSMTQFIVNKTNHQIFKYEN